eukprot:908597-Pelagomonas_calceolata.AAC.1
MYGTSTFTRSVPRPLTRGRTIAAYLIKRSSHTVKTRGSTACQGEAQHVKGKHSISREGISCVALLESFQQISTLCSLSKT